MGGPWSEEAKRRWRRPETSGRQPYTDEERKDLGLDKSPSWKKRNPERHAELNRAWRADNKEKIAAQNAVARAVRKGKLDRPNHCSICGTTERKITAHHPSYAPQDHLKVIWVCRPCHDELHMLEKRRRRT